jgi:3-deoxy-7-phosphoheptulonate synthase
MIVILTPNATERNIKDIVENLEGRGYGVHLSQGVEKTIIGVIGLMIEAKTEIAEQFEALPFVERCVPISAPYKLVGKAFRPEGTTINVRGVVIGGEKTVVMAGPCTVESEPQLMEAARAVRSPARTSCAAAPTSLPRRRIRSTGTGSTRSRCWPPRGPRPGCRSSPR